MDELEQELKSVALSIMKVENQIEDVEQKMQQPGLSEQILAYLIQKEHDLRQEKQALRQEKYDLRRRQERLEERLGFETDLQRSKKYKMGPEKSIRVRPETPSTLCRNPCGILDAAGTNYFVGRFPRHPSPVPVFLMFHPFLEIARAFNDPNPPPLPYQINKQDFESLALFYRNESDRQEVFLRILKSLLESIGKKQVCVAIFKNGVTSHGTLLEKEFVVLNLEVKNERGVSGESYIGNVQYYAKFLADTKSFSCRPALLVDLAGPHLQVSGILVSQDGELLATPLTTSVPLLSDQPTYSSVLSIFHALKVGLNLLFEFYENESQVLKTFVDPLIPDMKFLGFPCLQIEQIVRLVYVVSDPSGQKVVVKICKSYCAELHQILAAEQLAPKLAKVIQLVAPWRAIVMEYLDLAPVSHLWDNDPDLIFESARGILDVIHGHGFVHGDFRSANLAGVMEDGVFSRRVVALDFDFSGLEGHALYPDNLNPGIAWAPGVTSGEPIARVHDLHFLELLKKQVQNLE